MTGAKYLCVNTSNECGQGAMEAGRIKRVHACGGQRWQGQKGLQEGVVAIKREWRFEKYNVAIWADPV